MPDSKQIYRHQGKQAAAPGLAAAQVGGMPSTLLDECDLAALMSKAAKVRSFTRNDTAAPERETSQCRSFGSPRTAAVGSQPGAPLAPCRIAPADPGSSGCKGAWCIAFTKLDCSLPADLLSSSLSAGGCND